MTRIAVTVLLIATFCACNGKAKPQPVKPKQVVEKLAPEDVVTGVKRTVEQYRQAYEVRSLDALEPLYAKGEGIVITHQGKTHRGMSQVAAYLNKLLRRAQYIRMKTSAVTVIALGGQGAAVTATLNRAVGDGVTTVETTGTLTLALKRFQKRWVIVSEHFSYPPVR